MRARAFAFGIGIWSAALGGAAGAQAPEFATAFRFFKRTEPLRPDLDVVAVLPGPGVTASRARDALLRRGVAAEDVREFALAPWLVAKPPRAARRAGAHARFVRELAGDPAFAFASPQWRDRTGAGVIVLPSLVVAFKAEVPPEAAGRVLATARAGVLRERESCGVPNAWRLDPHTRSGIDLLKLSNALAARPEVRFSEPGFAAFGRPQHVPDDPAFRESWGLHNGPAVRGRTADLGCPDAWELSTGVPEVPVLVLDSGVSRDHPDLVVAGGYDATGEARPGDGGPDSPLDIHGTAVAGCISATMDNGIGGAGVAPDCALFSARVYRGVSRHGYVVEPASVARALRFGRSRGARVSNFSAYLSVPSALTAAAYERAYELGMVHFAAAGNSRSAELPFPASLPFVNAVGAVDPSGDLAAFSNFGPGVAFVAPGADVYTTDLTGAAGYSAGDYAKIWGTSFASPLAAGVAALVLSVDRTLDAPEVEEILRRTATDMGDRGPDPSFGHGMVHAGRATRAAVQSEEVAGTIVRASVAASGLQGDGPSADAALSADGRYVAFTSEAADLTAGDEAGFADVFVRDRLMGTMIRISCAAGGRDADGAAREAAISADGRLVAFSSYAMNLADEDRNGTRDVFVYDRDADEDGVFDEAAEPGAVVTTRIGGAAAGSGAPAFSADGRLLVFESAARDLVSGDDPTEGLAVYIARRDGARWTVVARVSPKTAAPPGRGDSRRPAIAPNGRTVAFESAAPDLVHRDANERVDVFLATLDDEGRPTGRVARLAAAGGGDPDGETRRPAFDGRGALYVATMAANLEAAPRALGRTRIARRAPDGAIAYVGDVDAAPATPGVAAAGAREGAQNDDDGRERATPALHERLAPDFAGRTLLFVGLGARAATPGRDAFRLDLATGRTARLAPRERLGLGRAGGVALSADGRVAAFDSDAVGLVRGDTNLRRDVFVVPTP